jgi:hypothetical protein
MQLTDSRKIHLAGLAALGSVVLAVYMLTGSAKIGPPFRDDALTAGPEPLLLLNQASVQKELRLSKRQIQQVEAAGQRQFAGRGRGQGRRNASAGLSATTAPRPARMGRKHEEAFVAQMLNSQQLMRLHQITLQQVGGLALGSKQTADDLSLTISQRKQVNAVLEKLAGQRDDAFQQRPRGPEAWQQFREARQAAGEKLLALLTPDQQTHWNNLTGAPFTGELTLGPRGFQGGGPGRGPRPGGRRGNPLPSGPEGGPPAGQPGASAPSR